MRSYLLSTTSSDSERCSLLSAAEVNDMTEELSSESLQADCDVRIKFSGDTTRVLFRDCFLNIYLMRRVLMILFGEPTTELELDDRTLAPIFLTVRLRTCVSSMASLTSSFGYREGLFSISERSSIRSLPNLLRPG